MEPEKSFTLKRSNIIESILFLLVAVLVVGFFFFYRNSQAQLISQKRGELKLLADNIASDHEGSIYGIRQFLITSGYLVEQAENDKETCQTILQKMYVVYPYFINIGITDKDGNVTCTGVEIGKAINLKNDLDFIEASSTQSFTVSGYRNSAVNGRPAVRFLQPITKEGSFSGVLFVTFASDWLNGFSSNFDLPQGTVITKFDKDGVVFMRYPNPLTWSGTEQADSELFKLIQEQKNGFAEVRGLEGNKRIYYFRPIYQDGKIHAYVAVGADKLNK